MNQVAQQQNAMEAAAAAAAGGGATAVAAPAGGQATPTTPALAIQSSQGGVVGGTPGAQQQTPQRVNSTGSTSGSHPGGKGPGGESQPGPGVLEAVKKVQEEANRQSNFGKGQQPPQMVVGQMSGGTMPVSYTHLTLPTNREG